MKFCQWWIICESYIDDSENDGMLKKLTLLLISFFITLGVVELVMQILDLKPNILLIEDEYFQVSENSILGYINKPYVDGRNSIGLRNAEIDIEKDDSRYRIMVLGDSIAYGCCFDSIEKDPQPFGVFLGERLNNHINIEVINAAVSGYNTIQEAEYYKVEMSKYKPDLIILQTSLNDWMPKAWAYDEMLNSSANSQDNTTLRMYQVLTENYDHHIVRLRTFQYLYYVLSRISLSDRGNSDDLRTNLWAKYENVEDNKVLGVNSNDKLEIKFKRVDEGLNSLKEYLNGNEQVLVVIFPFYIDEFPDYPDFLMEQHNYLRELINKTDFDYLDLLSCYQEEASRSGKRFNQVGDYLHPTSYGHNVAADCIGDYVLSNYLSGGK